MCLGNREANMAHPGCDMWRDVHLCDQAHCPQHPCVVYPRLLIFLLALPPVPRCPSPHLSTLLLAPAPCAPQLMNVLVTKTRKLSIFQHGIRNNTFLFVAVVFEVRLRVGK